MNKANLFWLKVLMAIAMATPVAAQPNEHNPDTTKQAGRAREFVNFLVYNAELEAYINIKHKDCKKVEKIPQDTVDANIKNLVRDSTKYVTDLAKQSTIVNKIVPLDERPDYVYLMYDMLYAYEKKSPKKATDAYIMGETITKYNDTIRNLRLMRYAKKQHKK